jgi:hypothetical protein
MEVEGRGLESEPNLSRKVWLQELRVEELLPLRLQQLVMELHLQIPLPFEFS